MGEKDRVSIFRVARLPLAKEGRWGLKPSRVLEGVRERLGSILSDSDRWGIARKLVLDQRSATRNHGILRMLGFVHLLTETGIHLYALLALLLSLASFAGYRQRIHPRRVRTLCVGFGGAAFLVLWCLSGFRVGLLRPLIVVLLRIWAKGLGLRWRLFAPLLLSVGFDIMAGPSPGRWHYFVAVMGGLLALEYCQRPSMNHWAMAWGSFLPIAVWDMVSLGWVAWATPIISIVTIPVLASLYLPGLLLLSFFQLCGVDVRLGIEVFNETMTASVNFLMKLSLGFQSGWFVSKEAVVLAGVFSIIQYVFLISRKRLLFFAFLFRLLVDPDGTKNANEVLQVDVGQGDAAVVKAHDGTFGWIDGGAPWAWRFDQMLKFFLRERVEVIRWVFVTHWDLDHGGSLRMLSALIPIHCLGSFSNPPKAWRIETRLRVMQPSQCVPFPTVHLVSHRGSIGNRRMGGVVIPLGLRRAYLNLGDAGKDQELTSLAWLRSLPFQSWVWKVSHHGSRSSSAETFLRALSIEEAWISAGQGNPYGHPSPEVLHQLKTSGIRVRRTDREGDLR